MGKMKCIKTCGLLFLATALISVFSPTESKAHNNEVKPTKVEVKQSKKTVNVGDKFTLRAKTTPADAEDDYLKWYIVKGKNIIRFEDKDRTDDDMDFIAKKKGTAKVCVKIKGTKKTAYVTVKVRAAGSNKGKNKRVVKNYRK